MDIPRHWRLKKQRYCLIGEICNYCDEKIFPPKGVCPACGGREKSEAESVAEAVDLSADAVVARAVLAKNPPERV